MDNQNLSCKDKPRLKSFLTEINSHKYDIAVLTMKDISALWITIKHQMGQPSKKLIGY